MPRNTSLGAQFIRWGIILIIGLFAVPALIFLIRDQIFFGFLATFMETLEVAVWDTMLGYLAYFVYMEEWSGS